MYQSIVKVALVFCIATLTVFSSFAKNDDDSEYRQYADGVRKEVYAMSMPEFENPKIPAEYQKESAVIMARYINMTVGKKIGFGFNFFLTGDGFFDHNVLTTYMQRELIYIGDEAALKEYSEYEFSTHNKNWTRYGRDTQKRVLGVKVIKKSGKVIEVPTDDFIIESEGKDEESGEKTHKLAVPGLEVGDYIDIMAHTTVRYQNHNMTPLYFDFADTKPMLSYKVHCEIDRKLATYYRAYNGATHFTESQNSDGDIVLDASISNVEKLPSLWTRYSAQLPYIMIQIYNLRSNSFVPSFAEKGVHYIDYYEPQLKIAINDVYYGCYEYQRGVMSKKYVRKAVKNSKKKSEQERVESIYDAVVLTLNSINYKYYSDYFKYFIFGLDRAKIKYQPFLTTSSVDEPIDEAGTQYNMVNGVYIPSIDEYYMFPPTYMAPGEIRSIYQGRKAYIKEKRTWRAVNLPAYNADENTAKVDIQISLEGTQLNAHRHVELSGVTKEFYQKALLTERDVDLVYRRTAGIAKTREEEFYKSYVANYHEQVRNDYEQQSDNAKDEVKYFHGKDVNANFKSYNIECTGTRRDSASFIYNVDYTIDGLVKKAGKNIIVSIGKLMDEQIAIDANERKRNTDIYYTPRSVSNTISIDLPSGCTITNEALTKLNTNVSNECASFVTKATTENGKLILTTCKTFKNNYEPKQNWSKILEVVDAAKNFENTQVVISK